MKSFMVSSLKTHGFGTTKSEENMRLQLTRLIDHLESQPDNTISKDDLRKLFMKAGACVIMKILVGREYDFEDEDLEKLLKHVQDFMNCFMWIFIMDLVPEFIEMLIRWPAAVATRASNRRFRQFFRDIMQVRGQQLKLQLGHL